MDRQLTRPQRRGFYGVIVGIVVGIALVALWSPHRTTWTAGQTNTKIRVLGMFGYLHIFEQDIGMTGTRGPAYKRWMQWEPPSLMATVVLTAGVGFIALRFYTWGIRRRLTDRCDECGYALHESDSKICPECGTDAPAR